MRQRCENTGSIAGVLFGTHRTPVGHVDEYFPCLRDEIVTRSSLDMSHKSDAAGIVLELRIVEMLFARSDRALHEHSFRTKTRAQSICNFRARLVDKRISRYNVSFYIVTAPTDEIVRPTSW